MTLITFKIDIIQGDSGGPLQLLAANYKYILIGQ